jgi:asparagine synthase (glutamine-hydrolysing)
MDGNGGDDTINPRVGNMLQHFLRKGMLRRFATELAAHRNYSRESWWRIFRSRLAIPFAPLWVRRLARNLRHRFAPTWAGRMIAPPFAIAKIKSGAVNLSNLKMAAAAYMGPRNQMLHSLRDWAARHRRNNSNEAAAHGLEFAMPFRDKRVVEFALAIPEELYVKNGQYRYLACRALADVYPPEFQERRIGEASELDPGMHAMVAANLPLLHEDIERMSRNPNITKYIDLDSARRALADVRTSASLTVPMRLALRAIYAAKYVAWFRGDNA